MDTVVLRDSWGKVVAAGDDTPLSFCSHLSRATPSCVDVSDPDVGAARQAGGRRSELNQGLRFSFEYTGSAVHDVASSQQRAVAIDDVVALSHAVQVSRVLGEFPKPDPSLPTEGSVAYELRLRWRAQREGRERLSGACYAIPIGLESNLGGNLDKAAARLSVDKPVLSTIGKLTARENPVLGRADGKAGGAAGPLTEAEVKWLDAVPPRLIRRAAEYEAKVLPPANHYGRSTTAIRLMATIAASPRWFRSGHRRWLLIEGLFAAVQPIRKPVASLHDPRLGSFCSPNRTRA